MPSLYWAQAILVGLMSDLWIACLGSVLISFTEILLIIVRLRRFCSLFRNLILILVLVFTSVHYSYVQFFHYPLIPQHLSYMTDPAFLRGNLSSAFSPGALISFISGLGILWVMRKRSWSSAGSVKSRLLLALLVITGPSLHALHIRYKVQWFVPETLQYNLFEGLAFKAGHNPRARPLSEIELSMLSQHFQIPDNPEDPEAFLEKLHLDDATTGRESPDSPLMAEMTARFHEGVKAGKKPLLLTVLMESFRYADSGLEEGTELTPAFNRLASKGVVFHQAYSVSNVTRGGQEAVWCGYQSSQGRSAMRDRMDLPLRCLSDDPGSGETFWIHGGEGRFDNQKAFWEKHGVAHLIAKEDLPAALARTGWGIGDYSLSKIAANKISGLHQHSKKDFLFGMILTVSNHIPWDVPEDAPARIQQVAFSGRHSSEKTVFYADMALGRLMHALKEDGLWDQSLIVVVGDHGIRAPALNPAHEGLNSGEQLSHISLILSGGIAEASAEKYPEERHRRGVVSQADIAAFWARFLKPSEFRTMSEPLLRQKRLRPVFSDLGSEVYFPRQKLSVPTGLLLKAETTESPEAEMDYLFYRSLIQWIDLWSLKVNSLAVSPESDYPISSR